MKTPTDRSFGYTFAVAFSVVGAWQLWHAREAGYLWIGGALLFALAAVLVPRILHPLNVGWFYVGLALNKVVSPVVLGAVFFLLLVPVGLVFRLRKRDALRREFQRDLDSYWIERVPPGPAGDTFRRQF